MVLNTGKISFQKQWLVFGFAIWDLSHTLINNRVQFGDFGIKKKVFLSPINYKKPGKVVDIEKTTAYSAMQLNLNPLEYALFKWVIMTPKLMIM